MHKEIMELRYVECKGGEPVRFAEHSNEISDFIKLWNIFNTCTNIDQDVV
jgi:hypothetical protein